MKDKKNIILSIAFLIIIAFTMLLFFGIGSFPKTGIQITSFIFILLAEILVFVNVMLILNKQKNTFLIAGLSSTSFIYTLVSILFNILLVGIFKSIKGILIFNFSILLIYLFISSMVVLFAKEN